MESRLLDDFIKYAKEQFGCDIALNPWGKPDTFESIFGASFLNQGSREEKMDDFESELHYENSSVEVHFNMGNDMSASYECSNGSGKCKFSV